MRIGAGAPSRCTLVISPSRCFEPQAVREGQKLWGVSVQLYTVRSRENWGIGDFGDLKGLIRWLAPHGAGFIGLNPLHALAPADPARASPYSASNRHFLNVLYISVPAVPEYRESAEVRARVDEAGFRARLESLRAAPLVDYRGVAGVKLEILELLFREFRNRHLALGTERAGAFASFVAAGGAPLKLHARFDALDEHLCATHGTASGWLSWPSEFKDPQGPAAAEFAAQNAARIDFHLYLQWLAHEQLTEAQALARDLGMPIGLYGDYAVGTHPSGSETWVDRTAFRLGAEIGAPPDALALKGQGWGLPPPDPTVMESDRLEGFSRLIGDNMRYYGALRLDHVMSLFRLWWVPAGRLPTEGAYVHYPLNQLLTVLSLASAQHACLVVGEDLGVVPDEMRRAMPSFGLYHYKVVLFEKDNGRFRGPGEFVREALATVTTHDMPTLRSFWEGRDIDSQAKPRPVSLRRDRGNHPRSAQPGSQGAARGAGRPRAQAGRFGFARRSLHARARTRPARLSGALQRGAGGRANRGLCSAWRSRSTFPGRTTNTRTGNAKLSEDLEDMAARRDFDGWFEDLCRARAASP
jgi:4-alpha-glucanotransferase